jgi:dihydrofolate reductase
MGGATYRQVLGFGEWPYGDLPTTVMTRQGIGTPPKSTITAHSSDDVDTLLVRIRAQTDGAIWLVGGAQINALFGAANAIDEVILSIMPVFLGDGIPLFQGQAFQQTLARPDVKSFSTGVVQITYRRP